MKKRNLLYLGRFYPYPPNSGGKKVTFETIKILSAACKLDCVFFRDSNQGQEEELTKIINGGINWIELVNFKRYPIYMLPLFNMLGKSYYFSRDRYAEYSKVVLKLLSKKTYHAIFIDEIFGVSPLLEKRIMDLVKAKRIKIYLQAHNFETQLLARYVNRKSVFWKFVLKTELKLSEKHECEFLNIPDKVIFISKENLSLALKVCGNKEKFTYCFPGYLLKIRKKTDLSKDNKIILHIGSGHWPPNVEGLKFFLSKVYPLVRKKVNDVKFIHIGRNTSRTIKKFHNGKDILIFDYIEDVESYYRRASVFVVPLLSGSGIKIKILDAMGYGLPIVTTSVGIEGIPKVDGIIVADEPGLMASKIVSLLNNVEYRVKIGAKIYDSAKIIRNNYSEKCLLNAINID